MTTILSKAFEKAAKLPDEIQEQVAEMLIEYIDFELKWDETLENSQDQLAKLADKALEDYQAGRTKKMGFGVTR